jgi:hypothetical protein
MPSKGRRDVPASDAKADVHVKGEYFGIGIIGRVNVHAPFALPQLLECQRVKLDLGEAGLPVGNPSTGESIIRLVEHRFGAAKVTSLDSGYKLICSNRWQNKPRAGNCGDCNKDEQASQTELAITACQFARVRIVPE